MYTIIKKEGKGKEIRLPAIETLISDLSIVETVIPEVFNNETLNFEI